MSDDDGLEKPPVTPAAIAAAAAWLETLRDWQIERMVSFATKQELLAWLYYRTPDELDLRAVVIALHRLVADKAQYMEENHA